MQFPDSKDAYPRSRYRRPTLFDKDTFMRSIKLLLASGIVATALVSTTATTALAQTTTIKDLRNDVVQYDGYDDDSGTVLTDPAATAATGIDATSARFKHTKKSIAVLMRFSNLTSSRTFTYAGIRVKGKTLPGYWIYSNGSKTKGAVYDRKGKRLCSAKFTTKSGASGSINFVVSRKCLKYPKSIKVQVGLVREKGETPTILDESISATKYKTTSESRWIRSS